MTLQADHPPADIGDWPRKHSVFGVSVSVTHYQEAVECILAAAQRGRGGIVDFMAVHGLVMGARNPAFRQTINAFDLVASDGQPVRWALNRLHDAGLKDRVYGPELTLRLCAAAAERGVGIYLYGGTPAVLEKLREVLRMRYPSLRIAGWEAPPFRPLTQAEDQAVVQRINASGAGVVLVGIGCPKQELFAFEHRHRLKAVQLCVGAAFDFHAGVKRMAPRWMQRMGLEWLFRLTQEPGRLWKRYLVMNTLFVLMFCKALVRRGIGKEGEGKLE